MHDVIIIGGGLAGCSAAIQLADQGAEVLLLEKGHYPRHKLCGEFLSPESQEMFERLGVLRRVHAAGAHGITKAYITAAAGTSFEATLPGTALGLSRYRLDPLLFDRAMEAGADGKTGARVRTVDGDLGRGFTVYTDESRFESRVVIGAYGKRGMLDRTLDRPFLQAHHPYVAFKAHYTGADLADRIEIHAFPQGYCGLSHVEDGRVNACWISHEAVLKAAGGDPEAMIARTLSQNPVLAGRFASMERVSDSFEAVSQVSLARKAPVEHDICMIGDTAGMIAPLCGDGMAMALRSAELVVPPVADFLEGRTSAARLRNRYARAWTKAFGGRLRLGRGVHRAALHPTVAAAAVRACRWMPGLARWLIRHTRG